MDVVIFIVIRTQIGIKLAAKMKIGEKLAFIGSF